jgi:hypothetical protein
MGTEKLKFKLELYATMWDLPPHVKVGIIDEETDDRHYYFEGAITSTAKVPSVVEFFHPIKDKGKYKLLIERSNKVDGQTIIDNDGKVVMDQLLHIKTLEIDDIELGALMYDGIYKPKYPERWYEQQKTLGKAPPAEFNNCDNMGFNGEWTFGFQTPWYEWLLENLY